ncbi:MAG: response regulator [Thermodesulfobacteriota bacterium]
MKKPDRATAAASPEKGKAPAAPGRPRAALNEALLACARAVLEDTDFATTARMIFDHCSRLVGSSSGYVALLSADGGENEVLFLEAGDRACAVDPELPMPIRGLRAEAYRSGQPILENDFAASRWQAFLPAGHVPLDNVLFAPLNVGGRALGVMGLANKPGGFTAGDLRVAAAFADLAALALRQRRDRESLQESEERYRSLFDDSRDAIFLAANGRFFMANPAMHTLVGCSPAQLAGTPVASIFARPAEMARFEASLAVAGGVRDWPCTLRRQDGTLLDCLITASQRQSGPACFQAVVRDVTAERQLAAQLRQAQKMEALGTLAGGIAHDFNNLLAAILGFAELAMGFAPDEGPQREYLQAVVSSGHKARDLVKQILAFGRQAEQERIPFNPVPLVKEALKLLRATIPSTIEIRSRIDPAAGTILADPSQFEQVLMNLATNAFHAMEERGGVLEVRLTRTELAAEEGGAARPYVELAVTDTGCGIEPRIRERIFDPYFTTKGVGRGTGLGLSVVLGIVRGLGGSIRVESEPDHGSTFRILVPAIEQPPAAVPAASGPLPRGHERLLVVDDDPSLVKVGQRTLERLGYRVSVATDGQEALELFCREPESFDLVITDQTMPGLTGAELARSLLRLRPSLPIILCTGYSSAINAEAARLLGIRGFILKPFTTPDLARLVRDCLGPEVIPRQRQGEMP